VEVVENFSGLQVGDNLLDAENEFGSVGLDLEFVPYLIVGERGFQFVPVGPWQFQKIVEDKVKGFLKTPTVRH
jgi:hypothetical protein